MFGTFHQEWKYVVATKQQASEKIGPAVAINTESISIIVFYHD